MFARYDPLSTATRLKLLIDDVIKRKRKKSDVESDVSDSSGSSDDSDLSQSDSDSDSDSEVEEGEESPESHPTASSEASETVDVDMAGASESSESDNKNTEIKLKASSNNQNTQHALDVDMTDSSDSDDDESEIKLKSEKNSLNQDINMDQDPDYLSKHKSIFKKLNKVLKRQVDHESESDSEELPSVPVQDLQPLPQPTLPRDKRLSLNNHYLKNLDWLAKPLYSSPDETRPFSSFHLSPFMINNLTSNGFKSAFSVQISVLDIMLENSKQISPDPLSDILVNASTGSGKTLAYSIPIIESLHKRKIPRIRAIILVPTKPLINQVKATFQQLSKNTNLSIVSLKNDISVRDEQEKLLKNTPDIIVSTPGRLVEHLSILDLSLLSYLVIDEADRLLNQSFQNWASILIEKLNVITNVSNSLIRPVQKLIFSATLTTDSGKLLKLNLIKPKLIIVNQEKELVNELFNVPSLLKEFKIHLGTAKTSIKPLILAKYLISSDKLQNILIFTKSNESSLRLAKLLQLLMDKLASNINITYINSTNNKAAERTKILKDFSEQKINIVIATDLIARGVDILSITDVINYDLPNSSREYVHRVGRTARANQVGNAISLCFGKGEDKWFRGLMKDVGRSGKQVEDLETNLSELVTKEDEQVYQECLEVLQKQVERG